eukprot:TRINITY_DN2959_c1_g1_i1.p1 TRINITY_DN2959_c1_g1~~TRINITY_DN2959_c1_g1_i1.p1  ORF type:complete len:643 (+),score=138.10 TRINITY_DN2959_c1_g1_i1:122-2050(+)
MEDCKARNVKALNLVRSCKGLSKKVGFEFSDQLQTVLVALNGLSEKSQLIEVTAGSVLSEIIDTFELFQTKVVVLSKQKKIERFLTGNKNKKKIDALLISLRKLVNNLERVAVQATVYLPIHEQQISLDADQVVRMMHQEKQQQRQQQVQHQPLSPQGPFSTGSLRVGHNQKLDIVWNHLFGEESFAVAWDDFVRAIREEGVAFNQTEEQLLRSILDTSNTGCVTRNKLCEFLKSFGPLSDCVKNVAKITSCAWFHGYMTAEESHHYLEPENVGTFLVRFSNSKPGAFALDYVHVKEIYEAQSQPLYGPMQSQAAAASLTTTDHLNYGTFNGRTQQKVILSVLIESVGIGFKLRENARDRVFKSIHEVLNQYQHVLTKPFTASLANEPWFHGTMNSEEAEELLAGQPPGSFLVRFSSKPGCFAASFVDTTGKICKSLITRANGGYMFDHSPEGKTFRTAQDLVEEMRRNRVLLYPQLAFPRIRIPGSARGSFLSVGSSPALPHSSPSPSGSPQSYRDWSRSGSFLSQQAPQPPATYAPTPFATSREGRPLSSRIQSQGYAVSPVQEAARPGPFRRIEVQLWGVEEVCEWLYMNQLDQVAPTFVENQVNGVALLDLNELDMRNELKLVLGHRKKLLKALQEFV